MPDTHFLFQTFCSRPLIGGEHPTARYRTIKRLSKEAQPDLQIESGLECREAQSFSLSIPLDRHGFYQVVQTEGLGLCPFQNRLNDVWRQER